MKSRVINSVRARGSWLPRVFLRLPRRVVAAGSVLCVVTLSGCYYPYGYYPSGYYPAYYSPYSTAPATAVQQGVPAGQTGSTDAQQQQQQNAAPAYAVAPPPVYVAPPPRKISRACWLRRYGLSFARIISGERSSILRADR